VGILRASHREIDSSRSIHPQFPFHPHKWQDKVSPGTIVKLEIGIWAMGVDFDEGESISVRVSNILHTAQRLKCTNTLQRLGVSIPALPSINHSRIPDQSTSSIGAGMSSIVARNTPAPSFCPSYEECICEDISFGGLDRLVVDSLSAAPIYIPEESADLFVFAPASSLI
jgi:hypothetical protein